MKASYYTISKMFQSATGWNVYDANDAKTLVAYATEHMAGSAHYKALAIALLAQNETLGEDVAFPAKVIERFDQHRKHYKKSGEAVPEAYEKVHEVAFRGIKRITNGEEILKARLARFGVAN
ncbi:MAG: hypothetical protein AB1942_17000 [Pseudomonadota bacterium]